MAFVTWDRRNALAAASVVAIGTLCGIPLVAVLADGLANAVANPSVPPYATLTRSVLQAGVAAILATFLGALIAFQIDKLRRPLGEVMLAICALPLLLPSYIHALGWSGILSSARWLDRSAVPGDNATGWALSVWVLAMSYGPIATLTLLASLRRWDRRFTLSAWSHGLTPRAELRLRLRYLAAPATAATLVIFLLAFADFAVPDFFQVQTYGTDIFVRVSSYLDTAGATALALPVLGIAAIAFIVLARTTNRISLHSSYGAQLAAAPAREREATSSPPLQWIVLTFVTAVVFLPLAQLVRTVGGTKVMSMGFRMIAGDASTSYAIAAGVAALVVTISLGASYVAVRRLAPAGPWLRVVPAVLFALPASLLGLLAIRLWNHSGPAGWAYDAGGVLVIALMARWLPVSMEVLGSAWRQIGASQENAAIASGIPWGAAAWHVLVPQMLPATITAFALSMIFIFNELTLVTLLAPPGVSTIPLRIFQTVHYGPASLLAAICLWQVLLLAVPIALLFSVVSESHGRLFGLKAC
jgi:iron(III) transport system permease protein